MAYQEFGGQSLHVQYLCFWYYVSQLRSSLYDPELLCCAMAMLCCASIVRLVVPFFYKTRTRACVIHGRVQEKEKLWYDFVTLCVCAR